MPPRELAVNSRPAFPVLSMGCIQVDRTVEHTGSLSYHMCQHQGTSFRHFSDYSRSLFTSRSCWDFSHTAPV